MSVEKGDVLDTKYTQRLGLTQGSTLYSILFVIFINDIQKFGVAEEAVRIITDKVGETSFSPTADDVFLHLRIWDVLQE